MLSYLVTVNLFLVLFWVFYKFSLSKETSFAINRFLLCSVPVVLLVAPLLEFNFLKTPVPKAVEQLWLLEPVFVNNSIKQQESTTGVGIVAYLTWFYALGVLIGVLRLGILGFRVVRIQQKARKKQHQGIDYYCVEDSKQAFTFLGKIMIGEGISKAMLPIILQHERVHVKQMHSLDLCFYEILKLLCWFNPVVYKLQKELGLVHEYLVDSEVTKHIPKKKYYTELLNASFSTSQVSFINSLVNYSFIKKRIIMLQKSTPTRRTKLKYLGILPFFLLLFTYVSCVKETETKTPEATSPTTTTKNTITTEEIGFAEADQVPIFPGCEEATDAKQCMSEKVKAFVNENFDVNRVKEQAEKGTQRAYVRFKIDKNGNITNIEARASHKRIAEEAKRVVGMLPAMKPAIHQGQTIGVSYTLPITFKNE
ncbi:MAG: M56 family metallopeptidase [Mesonia hippocampi]|uniref:M56 family metallopeptidase n=1 Tax=Mesonia hippocampi TaxID=1628250 RepID=UPI003F9BFA95